MVSGVQAAEVMGIANSILLLQGERGAPGEQGPMGPRVGISSLVLLNSFGPSKRFKGSGTTLMV